MMNGSNLLDGFVPQTDAEVVARILEAGGEIIGKTTCEYPPKRWQVPWFTFQSPRFVKFFLPFRYSVTGLFACLQAPAI